MPDYQTMYDMLRSAALRALDFLPRMPDNRLARAILLWGLDEAEDLYIESSEQAEDE